MCIFGDIGYFSTNKGISYFRTTRSKIDDGNFLDDKKVNTYPEKSVYTLNSVTIHLFIILLTYWLKSISLTVYTETKVGRLT